MLHTRDYFQTFEIKLDAPLPSGSLQIGKKKYQLGNNWLRAQEGSFSLTAPVIFAGFGSSGDVANIDVRGKIVVTNMGSDDCTG
jgi:hypothetical protein